MDKNINMLRELIRILVRNLGILQKDEASCCGITISQCHTLIEIGRVKEVSLNDLAELLNLDKSTTSRAVNNLVDQGLIERKADEKDRRYIKIRLTESGATLFKGIEESMNVYYEKIFKSLPKEKSDQVIESLSILVEAIKKNKCC